MKSILRHLWFSLALIAALSAVLLLTDKSEKLSERPVVHMVTLLENASLEAAMRGVEQALRESGFKPGRDIMLKTWSAQGEISQLPAIFQQIMHENPSLVVTVSTPALLAAARIITRAPLVFTVASEPARLGLFLNERPENLCGVYQDPPVEALLTMALAHNPQLRLLGTLYNPSEINAVIAVEKIRAAATAAQVKLIEATVNSGTDLSLAAESLIQRGAQAIMVSSDNTVTTGFGVVSKVAASAGIPIFVTEPALMETGASGAVGDDYFEWGFLSGRMAALVLMGVSPSDIPIIPTQVQLRISPSGLRDTISRQETDPLMALFASHEQHKPIGQIPRLSIVQYSETAFAEKSREGIIDGFAEAGMIRDRDYRLRVFNAQGDMATLSGIMQQVQADKPELLLVISTPTLQASLRQLGSDIPIVFTGVADAVRAGAGDSETDHLPHITGITTRSPFSEMARLISQSVPGIRTAGTVFTPSEINSVLYTDWLSEALREEGIALIRVPVTSSAEVSQAAAELCRQPIQLVAQIADNMTRPAFPLIARRAYENNLPVFVFDSDQMSEGATLCLARDYYDAGREAAEKAILILKGADPKLIPFSNTRSEKLIINKWLSELYGLRISDSLRANALWINATSQP